MAADFSIRISSPLARSFPTISDVAGTRVSPATVSLGNPDLHVLFVWDCKNRLDYICNRDARNPSLLMIRRAQLVYHIDQHRDMIWINIGCDPMTKVKHVATAVTEACQHRGRFLADPLR